MPWAPAAVEGAGLGDFVLTAPYAGLARTVFAAEGYGCATWRGDVERYAAYFRGGRFVQGDGARAHQDGAFTFHGRRDEVLNVAGVRVGVEELERDFPNTRLVIGGVFAVSFFIVRGVIWPYLTYFYCRDGFRILDNDPDIHSRFLVKLFMGGLLTLSVMQVIWLGQIVLKLREELGGMLSSSKAKAA